MTTIDTEKTYAVHEDDLDILLKNMGILDDFEKGVYKCLICEKQITRYNLGGIHVKDDKIVFLCDSLSCVSEFGGLIRCKI